MGAVYEAFDPELGRRVAIKIMHPRSDGSDHSSLNEDSPERLLLEAKNLARLAHPNVVPIYDVGIFEQKSVFLAMEFVPGQTLREVLNAGQHEWRVVLELVLQAGEGLAAAHAANLLHRDFKPDNLVVGTDGRVRVLDFGIASQASSPAPSAHDPSGPIDRNWQRTPDFVELAGTPAYMAPEQFEGGVITTATDLFAFACVLYEALCGQRPFPHDDFRSRSAAIAHPRLSWPASIPKWLRMLFLRALSADPFARGSSVSALVQEIRDGLLRAKQRRRALVLGIGVALVGALASVATREPASALDLDCRDPTPMLQEVWNPEISERVGDGFRATALAFADIFWRRNADALDQWQAHWVEAATLLCPEARERSALPALDTAQREASRACLNESRAQVSALLELWSQPTLAQMLASSGAVASVTAPQECIDLDALKERAPLPVEAEKRQFAARVRENLGRPKLLIHEGNLEGATNELTLLRESVRESEDPASMSTYALQHAWIAYQRIARDDVPFLRANLLAVAADRTHDLADALGKFWYLRVYGTAQAENDEEMFRAHEAAVRRANRPPELQAEVDRNYSIRASLAHDFPLALEYQKASLASTNTAFGEYSVRSARALNDLGFTAALMGEFELAEAYQRKTIAIQRATLPPGHPVIGLSTVHLALTLTASGRVLDAGHEVAAVVSQCEDAGLPSEYCAPPKGQLLACQMSLGAFLEAAGLALELPAEEERFGRRFDTAAPPALHVLSNVVAKRGELRAARALRRRAQEKLEAEIYFHPTPRLIVLLDQAGLALELGEINSVRDFIAEIEAMLAVPNEENDVFRSHLFHLKGRLALSQGRAHEAIAAFEHAFDSPGSSKITPLDRPYLNLDWARALADAGDLDDANDRAQLALAELEGIEGIAAHLRVPFRVTLADIAIRARRYGDALAELEQAQFDFNAAQILDNRRAPIYFAQAQAWLGLDDSPDGLLRARSLAVQARELYRDWDGGAERAIADVSRWLADH
jgi:tetratricopeptide (TPR) repeat protein